MCVDTSSKTQCPELDVLTEIDKINLDFFLTLLLLFWFKDRIFANMIWGPLSIYISKICTSEREVTLIFLMFF